MSRYFYLASPYSKYPKGTQAAYEEICQVAGSLLQKGLPVFCPILHSHPLVAQGLILPQNNTWAFWSIPDEALLRSSRGLIICTMEGWDRSIGVGEEQVWATKAALPIWYMEPTPRDIDHTALECGRLLA